MIAALDEYQAAVTRSLALKKNPFEEPSGVMLVRWLGPDVNTICIPGTEFLNPATHQLVGGLLTLTAFRIPTGFKSFSPGLERPPSLRFGATRSDYPGSSSKPIINRNAVASLPSRF